MLVVLTTTSNLDVAINPDCVAYVTPGMGVEKGTSFVTLTTTTSGESDYYHIKCEFNELLRKLNPSVVIGNVINKGSLDMSDIKAAWLKQAQNTKGENLS